MGNIFVILIVIGIMILKSMANKPDKKKNTQQPTATVVPPQPPKSAPQKTVKKKNEMFLNEEAKISTKTQWKETKPIELESASENTPKIDLSDTAELTRAVLYSEILHRKYE